MDKCAPTIEGACTIDFESKTTSIYFEKEDVDLSASKWLDIKYGKYNNCKATYYPISKEIIEVQYENKLDE